MSEQGIGFFVVFMLFLLLFAVFSLFIPFYGFIRKRWKGLFLGCLTQPLILLLGFIITIFGFVIYQRFTFNKYHKEAMVAIRKAEANGNSHNWYLKADEECFYEFTDEKDRAGFSRFEDARLFDVIPLDSFRVCVNDKIFVQFDLKDKKVTAKEFDDSIEVVSVNWDKVNAYFENQTNNNQK